MNGGQERRHRRQFEPPPWEQDAFRRFQQQREEQEKEAALDQALAELHAGRDQAPEQEVPEDPARSAPPEQLAQQDEEGERVISAARLEELVAGLREEEPRVMGEYKGLTNIVMALLAAGGLGFVVWSGVLLGKAGPGAGALQMMASLLIMAWGLMMIAFAVLLWRKYNL